MKTLEWELSLYLVRCKVAFLLIVMLNLFSTQGGLRIMNQDVKIDREGMQNTRTGERHSAILPCELEVNL